MKKILFYLLPLFFLTGMYSCLEDKGYTDIVNQVNSDKTIISWYGNYGTPNNRAVALPTGEEAPNYVVTLSVTSAHKIDEDFTVKVAVDPNTITEVNKSITKEGDKFFILPDSTYDIPNLSITVPKDTTEAPFIVTFYPDKIDKSKNYMLPIKIQDHEGAIVASNAGITKLTFIGNPLAGGWLWDFKRWNTQIPVGSPPIHFENEPTVFAPVDGVSLKVATGYYVQPNYLITFTNNGGVLSNFKAVIAPDEIEEAFTANKIKVVDGPYITVNADYTKFTINYTVFNGTAYRYLIDEYHK